MSSPTKRQPHRPCCSWWAHTKPFAVRAGRTRGSSTALIQRREAEAGREVHTAFNHARHNCRSREFLCGCRMDEQKKYLESAIAYVRTQVEGVLLSHLTPRHTALYWVRCLKEKMARSNSENKLLTVNPPFCPTGCAGVLTCCHIQALQEVSVQVQVSMTTMPLEPQVKIFKVLEAALPVCTDLWRRTGSWIAGECNWNDSECQSRQTYRHAAQYTRGTSVPIAWTWWTAPVLACVRMTTFLSQAHASLHRHPAGKQIASDLLLHPQPIIIISSTARAPEYKTSNI